MFSKICPKTCFLVYFFGKKVKFVLNKIKIQFALQQRVFIRFKSQNPSIVPQESFFPKFFFLFFFLLFFFAFLILFWFPFEKMFLKIRLVWTFVLFFLIRFYFHIKNWSFLAKKYFPMANPFFCQQASKLILCFSKYDVYRTCPFFSPPPPSNSKKVRFRRVWVIWVWGGEWRK